MQINAHQRNKRRQNALSSDNALQPARFVIIEKKGRPAIKDKKARRAGALETVNSEVESTLHPDSFTYSLGFQEVSCDSDMKPFSQPVQVPITTQQVRCKN